MKLFDFLRKKNVKNDGGEGLNTEFVKGIDFEDEPFEEETPDEIRIYDLNGKEVQADLA